MYKQRHVHQVILLLSCIFSSAFSQITVSPSSGCMPGGVTNALFTYVGSGVLTGVVWNFGDGSPTSTLTQTQHSYPNAGSFTVTFSALVNGSAVTYTSLVTVHPAPTGNFNFSIPNNHCTPMSVSFTGSSSLSNAVFTWAFGDLSGGSGNPVTHIYNTAGSFTPIITIQNTLTGCFVNIPGGVIHVSVPPNLVINANPGTFTCASTFTTAFTASNSVSGSPVSGGGLSYNWNFGAFGSSNAVTTGNIVFSPVGTYPVTLTATDNNNCSNTTSLTVSLVSPTINAVVPPTVCISSQMPPNPPNPIHPWFTATVQSSQPSTQWNMGDGNTITFPIPQPPPFITPILIPSAPYSSTIHTYQMAGPKVLTISAIAGQCTTSITRTIMVEEIVPGFTATPPSNTCSPSFTLSFLNQSTVNTANSLSYEWKVKHWDGQPSHAYTSTAANPSFTVTQASHNPYAQYDPPYVAGTTLYVTSQPLGCVASIQHAFDTIIRPTAWFNKNKQEGCVPLTVTFRDSSTTNSAIYPISSYTWNNGASPPVTASGTGSVIPNQVFTYTSAGTYTPYLIIETGAGCIDTSYIDTVRVVTPPVINYTLPASPLCANQSYQVLLDGAPGETIQHWHITSDNGYFSGCVTDTLPAWKFTHTGVHGFTISAYKNSCLTTLIPTQSVTVVGPIGKARYETNCTNKDLVKFYYQLQDVQNAILDFGDGSTQTITGIPNGLVNGTALHTYTASGNYTAVLTSSNTPNNCPAYIHTMVVTVRKLQADFTVDPVICKDGFLNLDASASIDVQTGCGRGYVWFADNYPPQETFSPTYTATNSFSTVGTHTIKLMVKDVNGCTDELIKNFRVSSPAPEFTFNVNPICLSGMPVQMINQTPQLPDPVSNYYWTMGDSAFNTPHVHSVITGTVANHSPAHAYPTIGSAQTQTFSVLLTATNNLGCVNSKRYTLTVNNPFINVQPDKYSGCAPAPRIFSFAAVNTHVNYHVNFGDSPPINVTTFTNNATYQYTHTFISPGTYTPVFTVTDNAGCTKIQSLVQSMVIQTYPVPTFTFFNKITGATGTEFCAPLSPSVASTTQSLYPLSYTWDLGIGGSQITLNPTAFTNYPDAAGDYTINLTVKTIPGECAASTQSVVHVYKPEIDFRFIPDSNKLIYCLGEPITMSVTTRSGVRYFQWDFGDGVVTNTISSGFLHKAVYNNTFFPAVTNGVLAIELVGYAGENLVCKDPKRKFVNIMRVLPDFKRNDELLKLDSMHCLGKQEIFKNLSSTNAGSELSYTWMLGDGSISTGTDVVHTYTAPGSYPVTLEAKESYYNCKASTTRNMTIFPLPVAELSVSPESCPGIPFLVQGTGVPGVSGILTGTLSPDIGPLNFSPANAFSLNTTASVSTTYSLHVRDDNGCENSSATASIYVQQPATPVNWDTTVIIGRSVPLNAYAGPGFTYTWTPLITSLNCDTCLSYNPISSTTVAITYSVLVEDGMKCSVVRSTYLINIEPRVSLDVPSAFTPNGDGTNDVIYPGGWGIRKLIYFKIFNRWGQLVFESNDLSVGWNGIFNGVPQNMETYVYQVSVETYLDNEPTLSKTGTFKLLR